MNLNKSREYFDPDMLNDARIHIIGCGAIGSTVAENLVRLGITKLTLWDFDVVNPHNIANQMFFHDQIKMPKVNAVEDTLRRINPDVEITTRQMAYTTQNLSGHVFLCVDNIEVRKDIVKNNLNNQAIKTMLDFRIRLIDAQHYAADWSKNKEKEIFLDSMNFTHAEATEQTPKSACGVELSVVPTVRIIAAMGVANFMNYIRTGEIKRLILNNAFSFDTDAL